MFTDITGRKRAEETLRESEEKYRNLVESVSDVIYTIDSSGVLTYISPVVKNTLGYEPDELIGRQFLEVVHKEDHDLLMRRFSELREGTVRHSDYRVIGKHGDIKWVRTLTNPIIEEEGFVGARGVLIDITERKKAEEALRASEENFRVVVENASDAILVEAGEGSHVYANQQAAEITGYCVAELLKTTIKDLAHPDDLEKIMQIYRRRLEGEPVPRLYETTIIRKDGKSVPIEVAGTKTVWQGKTADMVFFRDITERKQREEAYRTILRTAIDGFWIVDTEGRFLDVNDAYCHLVGYGREELLTMRIQDVEAVERPEETAQRIQKIMKTGGDRFETRHRRKDGRILDIEVSANYLEVGDGRVFVFLRDITERKQAEEALRESEERYRTILETTQEGYYEVDIKGNFTFLNDSFCRIQGYTRDELMDVNNRQCVDKESAQKIYQAFNQVYTTGEPYKAFDWEILKKDGTKRFVESSVSLIRDSKDERIGFRGIVRDITERKQAEEALQASKELFEKTFVSQRDAIFLLDAINPPTILDCNPAATEVFGYTRQEMVGRTMDFLHVDETALREFQRHLYSTIFEHGFLHLFEFRMRRKDGTVFPTEHSVTPLKDEQGERIGWVSVVRDITEHKQSEEKLRTYQEQLRSLVAELSLVEEQERRRIATDLHDNIGQILAMTKIKLGALREKESPIDLARPVDEIRKLIEQAIQYTRSLTFDLSPPVLYELGVEAAVEWLTEQIQEQSGILIDFEDDKKPKPMDDKVYIPLFKAVRELLINIVKHAQAHKAKVSIRREGNNIRIRVEDDGVGFNPLKTDCLGKTIGFGLFNIREQLNSIGGYLEIQSEPGQGTRITLVTPLMQNKKKKEESHERKNSHCRRPQNCSRRPPHFT